MDRDASSFPANPPGLCIVIGEVSIWVLGESRYRVVSPEGEQARELAHELAGV